MNVFSFLLFGSLSADRLLFSTEFGEVYTLSLTESDRQKIAHSADSTSPVPPRKVERVPRLWRALKVFSEPGSRSFAAIQLAAPSCYAVQEDGSKFDGYFVPTDTDKDHQHHHYRWRNSQNENLSQRDAGSILISADQGKLTVRVDKLSAIAGSSYLRKYLIPRSGEDDESVLTIPGRISSYMQFLRMVDDAKKLTDWPAIRSEFYPEARGLWDVEPDMEVSLR